MILDILDVALIIQILMFAVDGIILMRVILLRI